MSNSMKKKIAIFEIEYHLGFVKTLVELIDLNKFSLTIYTTKSNLNDLREFLGSNYNKVKIKVPKSSLFTFVYSFYRDSKLFDLCFYFTIQDHFLILPFRYLFFPKCKTILIALRVENYLGNLFHRIEKKKNIIHLVKNFIFNLFRYLIIKKVNAVITGGDKDIKILRKKFSKKKLYAIPYAINSKKFNFKKKKKLTIGVPGSIDKIRRDYFKILDLFKSLHKHKNEIELILIGSYLSNQQYESNKIDNYFKDLIIEIEKLKKLGFKIFYFKKKLNQIKYDKLIEKSDVMFTYMDYKTYMNHGWTAVYTETVVNNKYLVTNRSKSPKDICFIENSYKSKESFKNIILNFKKNRFKELKKNYTNIQKYFGKKKYQNKLSFLIENTLKF